MNDTQLAWLDRIYMYLDEYTYIKIHIYTYVYEYTWYLHVSR